jgi:hypothetical protein|nr:MAG TPA: Receptor Binding Protein [Caudoviricetes sp.]
MAITYGFYNSKDGDRKYYARQVSKIVDSLVKDGIFMHIGEHLNVKQGTGMQVLVEPGFAWFNHTWTENDADYPLTIEESDLLQPRIDAIVLEVDESLAVRANAIKVIKGAPASEPQKPTLTNTAEVHQYPLAYVSVAVGASQITNANIENRIGMEDCPFVTGILETINIDTLIQEWEAQFDEWFKSLEDTLSGDVAGNLLLLIQDLQKHVMYKYSATFKFDAWDGNGPYSQTVTLVPKDGGPKVTADFQFASPPWCGQVSDDATREKLLEILNLINNSNCTLGEGVITANRVQEKPTADIEVIWFLKKGGV